MKTLRFEVPDHKPATQGDLNRNRHGQLYHAHDKRLKEWRAAVQAAARGAMTDQDWPPEYEGLVECYIDFAIARPGSHWRADGRLRPNVLLTPQGDVDKLCRAVLDALTGCVIKDDAQVWALAANRYFRVRREASTQTIIHITDHGPPTAGPWLTAAALS